MLNLVLKEEGWICCTAHDVVPGNSNTVSGAVIGDDAIPVLLLTLFPFAFPFLEHAPFLT